jgi:hydroxymethylbilane synthase
LIDVVAFSVDGTKSITVSTTGDKNDPYSIGKSAGEELRKKGVNDLALNWREKVEEWNKT